MTRTRPLRALVRSRRCGDEPDRTLDFVMVLAFTKAAGAVGETLTVTGDRLDRVERSREVVTVDIDPAVPARLVTHLVRESMAPRCGRLRSWPTKWNAST